MRPLRLLATVALLGILPARPAGAAAPRPVVAVFGDSLVDEAAPYLRQLARAAGAEVRVRSQGGTALCDFLTEAKAVVADRRVAAVALAFTGNNLTPCTGGITGPALGDRYAADAGAVLAAAPGRPTFWVVGPAAWYPNPDGARVVARTAAVVRRHRGARLVDGAARITPGGVWSRTQPCLPGEPCTGPIVAGRPSNVVRAPDGVHFCPVGGPAVDGRTAPCPTYSSGARRYAAAILEPLLAAPAGAPGR